MNLQTFNATNTPNLRQRAGLPKLSITKKGIFIFNKLACELIKLKEKDKVSISQDSDDPINWYLHKDAEGFELRNLFKNTLNLAFNNSTLKESFCEAMQMDPDKTHSLKISANVTKIGKVEYFPIIL